MDIPTAAAPPEQTRTPEVSVELDVTGRVNFASAQNGVAVVNRLVVRNPSPLPLQGIEVILESDPPILRPRTWTVDRIAGGGELSLPNLDTPLDVARLAGLNEAEIATLTLRVARDGAVLCEEPRTIELLARDEWGGIGEMAALIAAFVSPNDAVVAAILKEASRLLENAGHDGSIEGYQSGDPGRVWMLAGAIWSAATGLGLSYAVPPASFERAGQKIRDPGRIRDQGLATCLDSALLLAACHEAAGLNPVVFFSQSHAWAGVWLTDRGFRTVTEPDVMAVRKAADAHELVMIETTCLTQRPAVGFEEAARAGRALVDEDREHDFALAVDIRRARSARIRPLASHRTEADAPGGPDAPASPAALPRPLDFGRLPGDAVEIMPTTAAGRIERWQRKLLDLSLRNRLLNFAETRQTLPLVCPDIAALEDALAGGRKYRTRALRDDEAPGPRDRTEAAERDLEAARDAFRDGRLAVPLTGRDMELRLLELYRRAASDLQEGGTNTLFLAAGFLRWKKTAGDSRIYRAPLLLIPVRLTRRSAQSEFVIEQHEDEARFNATLLEFLKRDFDLRIPELEGDLPRDENGLDVRLILETMRRKVRDVAGFEAVEDLALSTFSFAKFLMWKDLVERTDSLRGSAVVRHLVDTPAEPFRAPDAPPLPEPRDIDRRVSPSDLFTPLSADSSQLAAVVAADEGHDFVLVGPPGTGKSQTITNIIAQCLAGGKTVLFVAEKAAALDVVHRRLAAHGLGDAVVELHSNKADRKAVVAQLGRSWDRAATSPEVEWVQVTDRLRLTRDRLNAYVAALHRKGTQGFSVFEAIGRLAGTGDPGVTLRFANPDAHDQASYARLMTLAAEAGRCHEIAGGGPAFDLVKARDWSFGWEGRLLESADRLRRLGRDLTEAAARLRGVAGLRADPEGTPDGIATLKRLTARPATGPDLTWALGRPIDGMRAAAEKAGAAVARHAAEARQLSASYPLDRLASMPLDRFEADWRLAQTRIWPLSALAMSAQRKLLQTYATAGKAAPATDIAALQRLRELRAEIDGIDLAGCPAFRHADTDPAELSAWIDAAAALSADLAPLAAEVGDPAAWDRACRSLAGPAPGPLDEPIRRFAEAEAGWRDALDQFSDLAGTDAAGQDLAALDRALSDLIAQKHRLSDWTRWQAARDAANGTGLAPLVEAIEAGRLSVAPEAAFAAAYAAWWLPLAMDASDELRTFAHWAHEDAIAAFRDLDARATELAAAQVVWRVRHGLPARDAVPRRSELGTLRHQMGLQRPSLPIRTLIAQMPQTFTKLAPCVLMSPLSVAQYLPAGHARFDVVIFDEASQITTWDAIGAIARGRQAIIVGDPRQLPPTNFFGRADGGDDDLPEAERDMPSILDEVAAAGIPTRQLDWHYRSRDEALIAFSNWHYYGGRLVTFPSPETRSDAVQLHRVEGVYGRGQGRTNDAEARAIVRMLAGRLAEQLDRDEGQRLTFGVITFNAEQQQHILDLLDAERRADPRLEWFFDDARDEPVIVKNLENIQGDERDVMLFSVTFGPDPAGKLSMAFGALNADGGERRLNVAVTRARRELHVFASLSADQIDLTRTRATGVRHLKAFLDFAVRGPVALPAQDDGSLGPVESPFEAAVKEALERHGWQIRPQIGVSGFRVDLGVVHPDHAGVYLAGIECDGATYHGSATARDRDKIRQSVLEGLGWTILRVWSTDWFRNPDPVAERVHAQLSALLEADRQRRADEAERQRAAHARSEVERTPPLSSPAPAPDAEHEAEHAGGADGVSQAPPAGPAVPAHDDRAPLLASGAEAARPPLGTTDADPARFFEPGYSDTLCGLIADIAAEQGPLPLAVLARKVSARHGWQRTGRRIAERIETCLDAVEVHDENGVPFVWARGTHGPRVPFRGLADRGLRDVSRAELASLIDRHAAALATSEDPGLDLARLAGVSRLGPDSRRHLADCLAWREDNPA